MEDVQARRSDRLHSYDSNGRDYLADQLGWSRQCLETWLTSETVRPHLKLWHQVCIANPRRFNDAIEWINGGENGYYYDPEALEAALIQYCLNEDDESTTSRKKGRSLRSKAVRYATPTLKTTNWTTQELWARAAWRIVKDNESEGQTLEKKTSGKSTESYAFIVDLLCLAFHSIAFRGYASPYEILINGDCLTASNINKKPEPLQPTQTVQVTEVKSPRSEDTILSDGVRSDTSSDVDGLEYDTDVTSEAESEGEGSSEMVRAMKGIKAS